MDTRTPIDPLARPIRLAQIGAGYWGPNLIRNFVQVEGIESFWICDKDASRTDKIKTLYPHVRVSNSCAAILSDPDIDAVVLATEAESHYAMAREALEYGKHVFVEKPLTRTVAEAEDLVDLAIKKRRVLMVGHTFLFNEAVRKIKSYIDSGELGDIYYILARRLNLGKVRRDINAWWNLAPHDVSIILYWLNETPHAIQSNGLTFLQNGIEDVVFTNLNFPSGRAAHIHVSWLDPIKTRTITIVGSRKMLIYDDTSTDAKITIYDKGIDKKNIIRTLPDIDSFSDFHFENRTGDILIPAFKFQEPLYLECRHFIDCVRDGTTPLTDGRSALDVVRVLEVAQTSLRGETRAL